ncbi:ribonuclease 1-like [Chenopodium quinoa]|uniref:Uncharacterized protein n=1 Tax=Chenopodium quinoa TaxID=63459 RepID=A0A803MND6_CHEQI|nr:ribonuclease 1-like [Chenopodium quinoa]
MGERGSSLLAKLVLILSFAVVALGSNTVTNLKAFYLVQQWLGSYCNQAGTKCCYPPSGKPSPDFTIDGLWPYFGDGNFAYNCGNDNYDVGRIKFLQDELRKSWPSFTCPQIGRKFWVHEWNKHGTCTKSILGEIPYFEAALNLKNKANIYQALAKAGITPGNKFYSLDVIKKVLARSIGFNPWVRCNKNAQGNDQIWQVTFCADITGKNLIECPYIPSGVDDCKSQIQYPIYYQ